MTDGTAASGRDTPLLEVTNLSKLFGGAVALDDVSVEIRPGEIHGLLGQNGSGKSTLIKCLSGFHAPDSAWTLRVGDTVISRALHPGEAAELGISFVHQDLGVLPELSVLDNLMLARIAADHRMRIPWRRERKEAAALFASFGLDIDPAAPLSRFRPVEQAQVAVIRAILQLRQTSKAGAGVLVLDEVTTFLDRDGRRGLYELLRKIVGDGAGVLFVSHDVAEVAELTDRITILRDGRVVETCNTKDATEDEIVNLIVSGRRATGTSASKGAQREAGDQGSGTPPIQQLDVTGLCGEYLSDIDLHATSGEIIGITGIVGSGWESLLENIYGSRRATSGVLTVDGTESALAHMTPAHAVSLGMAFVPSDRGRQAIVADLSIQDNVMMPVLGRMFSRGILHLRQMSAQCLQLLRDHAVVPASPAAKIGSLSGGNQQKAVLGKWLQLRPRLILLNEPTQGVDVGARQLIFQTVRAEAARGSIVLYASGDWAEVARISDRVVVIADGRVCARLAGDEVVVDRIAQAAYLGTRRSADLAKASVVWEEGES